MHKYHSIRVIHLKNQARLPDFLFIAGFSPLLHTYGTDPSYVVGSVY